MGHDHHLDKLLEVTGVNEIDGVASEFVGQIAVAVWIGKLSDNAAREALGSYALACERTERGSSAALTKALLLEYRRRRERQDACS
jgi:hypothetical protein